LRPFTTEMTTYGIIHSLLSAIRKQHVGLRERPGL
jgi:hypothetical protein